MSFHKNSQNKNTLYEETFVVFDVETTGLSPSYGDRVIELAALKINRMQETERFHSLIDPQRELSYGAFLVNGITDDMLEGAPKAAEILPGFLDFIKGACLVGHNIKFDLGFLENELSLCRQKMPGHFKSIDTLRMARGLMPGLSSYSLLSVASALGVAQRQQHRAMADVELTFAVFKKLTGLAYERSMAHVHILALLFGRPHEAAKKEEEQKRALIEEALAHNTDLLLSYFSASSSAFGYRRVTPKEMVRQRGQPVLVAFCHLKNAERCFRLDRILHIENV